MAVGKNKKLGKKGKQQKKKVGLQFFASFRRITAAAIVLVAFESFRLVPTMPVSGLNLPVEAGAEKDLHENTGRGSSFPIAASMSTTLGGSKPIATVGY